MNKRAVETSGRLYLPPLVSQETISHKPYSLLNVHDKLLCTVLSICSQNLLVSGSDAPIIGSAIGIGPITA